MIFVFDIETIPDLEQGRQLYDLHGLSDEDTAQALYALRRAKVGHTFLPHYLQKIVCISIVMQHDQEIKVWSLGDETSNESELITRFFNGLEKHTPTLISWNGTGFDLPVLHYRSLFHKITSSTYWDVGTHDKDFKWNNYLNRYHYRHLDLMDILSSYQAKAYAPLDEIATMLGFPGKMGMSGDQVFQQYQEGNIKAIRNYCETDVLNTYCIYLRFELIRGTLTQNDYQSTLENLQKTLKQTQKPHLLSFIDAMSTK